MDELIRNTLKAFLSHPPGGMRMVYFAVSLNFHTSDKTQTRLLLKASHLHAAFHIVKHIPDGR